MVEIRLLGRFAARRDGEEIPPTAFGGRMVRTFVRLLVTRRGQFVSHDVAADALWPGRPPADPVANLQVLVTRARRALGDPSLILTGPGGYSFAADDRCVVDAELFLAAVEVGRERLAGGGAGAAFRELRNALDLWHGEPLAEDAYEDWAQEFRAMLARAHLQALESGAAAALAVRDPAQAVALAEQAVIREPLREPAHLLLAEALASSGDQAAALRALDSLRRRLVEELGLDPSPDVRELERRILGGEPLGLTVARSGLASRPTFGELAFVGREAEVEAILGAVQGDPGAAVVSGIAGTGKSRLLREVANRSVLPVIFARAFLPEREEAWALARSLLREALSLDVEAAGLIPDRAAHALADLVPELGDVRPIVPAPLDPESQRALALEGGVRLLGAVATKGALMVVDDLQWVDATSMTLLGMVARRVPELSAVFAYRPEELVPDGAVDSFLGDLQRTERAVQVVRLQSLARETLSRLVVDDGLLRAIAEETDGTPLAVAEVLRALAHRSEIEPDLDGRWRARTPHSSDVAREVARAGQRRIIQNRARREPTARWEILSLLALLKRETPARILAGAQGADERKVLGEMDLLARAGLVRLGDNGWATAHDMIGEAVIDALDRPERGRLHQLVAQALEAEGGDPAERARHLAEAGDSAAAAEAFVTAARQRMGRFAAAEAAQLADAGLSLDPEPATRSALLETRGEARGRTGDLAGARADLQDALAGSGTGPERSRLLARMAVLTESIDYESAAELADLALTEAGADPTTRAEALVVAAIIDAYTSHLDRAQDRAEEAHALFEQVGDAQGVIRALDARAVATLNTGRLREAAELLDQAARLYRRSGQLLAVGSLRATRGWVLALMGRPDEGLVDIDEALDLERSLNQTEGEALCLWVRAEALAELGRNDEAITNAEAAVALARQLGHRQWETTALCSLGRAHQRAGALDKAEAIVRDALKTAEGRYARARAAWRLASVLMDRGELEAADSYAQECLAESFPFIHWEPRLISAEAGLARGGRRAEEDAMEALAWAEVAGAHVRPIYPRIQELVERTSTVPVVSPASNRERRTFMFTDIVRSTNLVEAMGDEAWDHLLRWHDEALRSLFANYGGEEVNRIGDGFFVAFERAADGVRCAMEIQRALERHRVDHGFAPQVRIGLHQAETTREGADYQGRGVHEAARIAALAEGGEILASRSSVGDLSDLPLSVPRSVTLKGISEPVEVVSIAWR